MRIEELLSDRAPTSAVVVVRGRVLHQDGDVVVRDESGAVPIRSASPPAAGSLVEVRGRWTGRLLECDDIRVVGVPSGRFAAGFAQPESDHESVHRKIPALRLRHRASRAIRDYFESEDFLEIETPLMVPSPGLDTHLHAFEVEGNAAPRYLITSPEYQMKRVLAGGLPRIFQMARCFRRGEVGARHEPEFTLVEWYRAFAGAGDVMRDTENLVAAVATATLGTTRLPSGVDVAPPWRRRRVPDLLEEYADVSLDEVLPDEERFFRLWVENVEPGLGVEPVFVTHWPASMASLARLVPGDEAFADRFESYIGGVELSNGFGELVDAAEQRRRLMRDQEARRRLELPVYPIDEPFLSALEEGIPPSGGNALGFDRLVMLLSGAENIEEVLALPHRRL